MSAKADGRATRHRTGPSPCRPYARALVLARICDVFPLVCSTCGGATRNIALITDADTISEILAHMGEPTAPPGIAPAWGPRLLDMPDARARDFGPHAQPGPEHEFDQRIAW